jgi:hypothetical protein
MIDKSFIEKIESMSQVTIHNIAGVDYSNKLLNEVKKPATPDPKLLNLHTLSGIIDYIKNKLDDEKKYTVQIDDYNLVSVYGVFEPQYGRRKEYVRSNFIDFNYEFNSFLPQDMFVINLLSQFIETEELKNVIEYTGNVEDGAKVHTEDDGHSQSTAVKTGIVSLDKKILPNPVNLKPRRTFPEIEQPESQFVLRMQPGAQFALFEASGGFWRVECIHAIRDYLKEQLKGLDCVIIA